MTIEELLAALSKENPGLEVLIPGFEEYGYVPISRVDSDLDKILVVPKR